jgi:ADP-dependent NAD(P)H-hydrate dehydratase / NAD(P)H-hydrate epimerase
MGSVTVSEMLSVESLAMANGWTEEQLLNAAGERLGLAIGRFYTDPGTAIGYLGKGHNAGDTLVALRVLRDQFGWKVEARSAFPRSDWAPLVLKKWDELGLRLPLDRPPHWRDMKCPILLLDGLTGTGTSGGLRDPLLPLAREMEMLRQLAGARVAAIDLPSGIHPDTGEIFPGTVTADSTFMIGNAKVGLLHGRAVNATGALVVVPVEPLTSIKSSAIEAISPQTLDHGKSPRPFELHKGRAGRVAILAGSEHYTGAAVLAARGALRGGAGLITLHVPQHVASSISAKCPAEIIVRGFSDPEEMVDHPYDALVTGCGLGFVNEEIATGLLNLISHSQSPVVIDADALNLIARLDMTSILTDKHILTPHPGEFKRLAPDLIDLPREEAAREFADRFAATLLLKGSRTIVTRRGEPLWCNTTGNPGMATGGQGDVLAGVIGARLAFGDSAVDAAALAAWLCGRSAEIAVSQHHLSEESLTPSDVLDHLGAAYRDWKTSSR